jgi:hypothetical protein
LKDFPNIRTAATRISNRAGVARAFNTTRFNHDIPHHHHNIVYPPLKRDEIRGEFGQYSTEYDKSVQSPSEFWMDAASSLKWFEEPQIGVQERDYTSGDFFYDWFPDGTINTSYNCLDVHVDNGKGDQIALIYDSPLTDRKERYTYKELLDEVRTFAGALQNDLGVQAGDRVVIYMPLIPQGTFAFLLVHSFVRQWLSNKKCKLSFSSF